MAKNQELSKEDIIKKLKQKLEQDEDVRAWFNKYQKYHWEHFINDYARSKMAALSMAEHYEQELKPQTKVFNEIARDCLETIQQAKLFRLQCDWRAGNVVLPMVEITYDFEMWENAIHDCPFLHPVTMEEVEAYIAFLKSPDAEDYSLDNYYIDSWQDYEEFKKQWVEEYYADFNKMPEWYSFYDKHCCGGGMFELQDWRGEMEEYYDQISRGLVPPKPQKIGAPISAPLMDAPEPDTEPPTATKPASVSEEDLAELEKLSQFGPHVQMEFARLFEKPDDAEKILNYHRAGLRQEDFEEYDMYYDFLKTVHEPIKFQDGMDWKASLKNTVMNYRFKKIAEALPRIWRQYNREIGDPEAYMHRLMAKSSAVFQKADKWEMRNFHTRHILNGRKILGEPENFNY